MYKKMFESINNELNNILVDTPKNPLELNKNSYELMKIEIKGSVSPSDIFQRPCEPCFKVKFVFLNHNKPTVKVMHYEFDWFSPEPRLKFKIDYLKPYHKNNKERNE